MATVLHSGTLPDSSQKTDFYAIIDNATVTSIVNADLGAGAAIVDTKLAQITTSAKVHQSSVTGWLGAIEMIIDGGGQVIGGSAAAGHIEIPFACTLTSAKMYLDTSSVTDIDIWKDTYANFPPTVADSIVSAVSGDTTFSTSGISASKFSATISNAWTKAVTANDIITVYVNKNDLANRITVSLPFTRP